MNEASSLRTIHTTGPSRPRTIRAHPPGAGPATSAAGATILVVDDNPATRRFVRETLAIEGYGVIEAEGGAGAIEACAHEAPALVLIDLCMSDMRGTDVLRRLRSQPNTASTPIIVFTGAPEEVDDAHADAENAFSDLIAKPADAAVLLETVRAHLDPPQPSATLGAEQPRKVLLADDDPARLIRLRLHLRRLGFDAIVATNAETAGRMARQERPDAIIADLMLSDGGSLSLTRDLRADADLAYVPIVISSSTPWSQVQERLALRAGATSFVVATPDLGTIRDALVSALETPPTFTPHETDDLSDGDERPERILAEIQRQHAARRDAARSLERSQAELAVLQGLTEIVGGSGDLDTILTEALGRCLHAIGASRGAVFLTDLDGSFALHAHLGDLGRLPGARLSAGEELFHRVTSLQETMVVDDRSDADGRPSTIVTPIVSGDDCFGVLVVEVPAHEDLRFWMHFLQLAGLGLGFAVANARQNQRLPGPHEGNDLDMRDPLTGLATSTRLELNLATALEEVSAGQSGAMLLIDVDRIRHVNDALGHHTGDQLLKGIARRLAAVVHPGMTLARLHSDVFAVLAPAVDGVEGAADLARHLLRTLEAPVRCNGYTLYATASVGVALYPEHTRRPGELLQHAHSALDLAKGRGGDTCEVYTERTGDTLWQRLTLEQGLRAALEREQFVLHYQPIVELGTAQVTAAEALLRWDRPLHGITTAAGFIEIAEETGLIVPIGAWVLEEAAAQIAEWNGRGTRIDRLAVNVGAREFHDTHVEDTVRRVVDETGIDPASLSLEITERVALADVDHAVATLGRLRDLGIHTALDDFGTGYSSLRYLQELPIDTVKIDRSFVANAASDDRGRPILESIVELSHRLGMRVIAEGIETDRCLELVRSLGCDEAQGFHLGRPAPAQTLEELL